MVSDIYMFDLETFKWERVAQSPDDDIPQARYFHSADTCTYPALAHLITVLHFAQGGTILLSLVVWLSSLSQTTPRISASSMTYVFSTSLLGAGCLRPPSPPTLPSFPTHAMRTYPLSPPTVSSSSADKISPMSG